MIENIEWILKEDDYGKYKERTNSFGIIEKLVIERTQKWHDENPPHELEPQPSTETELLMDYVIDVDYRVTIIELGI